MQTVQHHLATGQARTLAADSAALTLKVLQGTIWLTQSGDASDYFLGPGQSMPLGTARVVVQAEGDGAAIFVLRVAPSLQATSHAHAQIATAEISNPCA
jgi:cellobiose phosphorylase